MFGNNAPQTFIKEVFNSESKSFTASEQLFDAKKVNVYGHIIELIFSFGVTITKGTGTIDTAKTVADSFNQLVIRDRDSRPVIDEDMTRLAIIRKILSLAVSEQWSNWKKGEYDAAPALTDVGTEQTYLAAVPIDINLRDQPISVEWKLGANSEVLSTVGTGTATGQLRIYAKVVLDPRYNAVETRRIYSFTRGAVATEQELQNDLPTGVTIDNITLGVTTDTNLTDVTLKPTGKNVGLDRLLRVAIQQEEDRQFWDGHTTAFYTLVHAPFIVGDSTIFKINPSTSFTPRIFITHRGVR